MALVDQAQGVSFCLHEQNYFESDYIAFKNVANIAQLLKHIKSAAGEEAGLYISSG